MDELFRISPKSLIVGIALAIGSSCSSVKNIPPEQSFINEQIESIKKRIQSIDIEDFEPNEKQAFLFLRAETRLSEADFKGACEDFRSLAKEDFALNQFALIKTLESCDLSPTQVQSLWSNELTNVHPAWKKEFIFISRNFAQRNELKEEYTDFSLQYLPYLQTRKEKEKFLIDLKKSTQNNSKVVEALHKLSPRFIINPKRADWLKVGSDYSRNRNFAQARKYFNKVIKSKRINYGDRISAYKKKAFTFKLERDKKRYSWQLERAIAWFEKNVPYKKSDFLTKKYLSLRIQSARAQWTVNFRSKAEKTLQKTINHPLCNSQTKANAYFILGKIEVEKKNFKQAKNYYKLGLEQPQIDNTILEYLTWNLGWSNYLDNNFNEALKVFEEGQERIEDKSFGRKLTFWRAKTHIKLNEEDKANDLLEELIDEDSYGFYGIASAMMLEEKLELENETNYEKELSPYPVLNWLITLKQFDQAKEFLKDLQSQIDTPEKIEEALPLYHFARWYEGGIFKFFRLPPEKQEAVEEEHLIAAFPLPHQKEILAEQKRSRLPAAFIYSIARQESAFNPKVRSWADAFGLLQVTPEKAKKLAPKLGLKYQDYGDLYDVSTNVTLGGELLRKLANRYDGQFIPTVAAYNAGETPVRKWMKARHRDDPFEFIEMIPYKETRNYIKLVLRNYATYSRLLNKEWSESKDFFNKKVFL